MSQTHEEPSQRQARLDLAIWLGLILSIFAVYAQVGQFDFIGYDDDLYVLKNPHVLAGLTPATILWAFTAVTASNWLPVTLLSHTLDVQLFGLQSGMHHLVNVVFHALAAVLLFAALQRATRARWPSAFVAFVFALHPLHVESVAWISERKDVLSAGFFFLTIYGYVRYTERPGLGRYLAVLGPFCLGLMSKPMVVTLPFTLLLLDFWPLDRVRWPKILWEKLPMFALSAGTAGVTYAVQRSTGAVGQIFRLDARIVKALLSYVIYIRQTLWPVRLAIFYPYPRRLYAWQAAAALVLILGVSALVIAGRRRYPYLATGWFWYLGTLVPVIGLVQAGMQAHADRYTYIPMVGLAVMVAWGAMDAAGKWPRLKPAIAAAAAVFCGVSMAFAWKQAAYWQNSETLYQRAIDVTADNYLAQGNLGQYLLRIPERRADAVDHLETALRIEPDYAEAHNNLGVCLINAGLYEAAIPHFEAVLRFQPNYAEPLNNLGVCLMHSGRYAEAIPDFEAALRSKPDYAQAHLNLGLTLSKVPGRAAEAIAQYEAGLRLMPDQPEAAVAHRELGALLLSVGRTEEAIAQFEAAQRLLPDPEGAKTIERLRAGQK